MQCIITLLRIIKMDRKIVHDINSALNAISLSFDLLTDDPQLLKQFSPLLREKIIELNSSWESLKERSLSKD